MFCFTTHHLGSLYQLTSLADGSFHIVASMYLRFWYSGKNQMRFAVFWRISVRFCGFRTLLTPPSFLTLPLTLYSDYSPHIHCIRTLGAGETRKTMRVLQVINLEKNPTIYSCGCNLKCFSLLRSINSNTSSHCLLQL